MDKHNKYICLACKMHFKHFHLAQKDHIQGLSNMKISNEKIKDIVNGRTGIMQQLITVNENLSEMKNFCKNKNDVFRLYDKFQQRINNLADTTDYLLNLMSKYTFIDHMFVVSMLHHYWTNVEKRDFDGYIIHINTKPNYDFGKFHLIDLTKC